MNSNDRTVVSSFIYSLLRRPGHWASLTESTLGSAYRLGSDAKDAILSIKSACETQRGRKGSRLDLTDMSEVLTILNNGYGASHTAASEFRGPLTEAMRYSATATSRDVCPTCHRPR